MTDSPFRAVLRYAFLAERSGLSSLEELVRTKVVATRLREPEDIQQEILFKIVAAPAKALVLLRALARRNTTLEAFLDALAAGGEPSPSSELVVSCDRQLAAYVRTMADNAARSRWRKQKREAELPSDEALRDPAPARDDQDETLSIGGIIRAHVTTDPDRPDWFDGALAQIEGLAEGTLDMAALTDACIAGDPSLRVLEVSAARRRATARLQKQHERVRTRLLIAVRSLVEDAKLTRDEGALAERWVMFLKRRRQNPDARASRGQS